MKILILGASGMAGHIITLYFKEQGYDVTGFTRRPISFCKNIIGDAMNPNDVKAAILSDDFDVVILEFLIKMQKTINLWLLC